MSTRLVPRVLRKPRNPFALAARRRAAGRHLAGAERRIAQRDLQREIARIERPHR